MCLNILLRDVKALMVLLVTQAPRAVLVLPDQEEHSELVDQLDLE